MYLKRDIYSTCTRKLYGLAGAEVMEVACHGNVKIVQDTAGNRFSVKVIDLTVSLDEVQKDTPRPESYRGPAKTQKKKGTVITQPLF